MFWLIRKKLSGSYFRFKACKRSYFFGPYDCRTRSVPSSPKKFTYTPSCHGRSADQKSRTHSRSSANPALVSVLAPMLYVKPVERPLNAVSSSPTRLTAPPLCQIGNEVNGEEIRNECSTVMSMMSSLNSATSQLLK